MEDPDVESFEAAITKALADSEFREELARRGTERAALFSWRDCAARTLSIIKGVGEAKQ